MFDFYALIATVKIKCYYRVISVFLINSVFIMATKILVVDDMPANLKLLEAKLINEFYEVVTASSGIEAIKIVENDPPDLILLDVMMPEMDGFETCKRIKKHLMVDIPIVMVTALSEVESRVQGLNSGADDFLTKPINDMALFARIRSLVRLKNMVDELHLRDKSKREFSNKAGISIEDIKNAKILLIDDDAAQSKQIVNRLKKLEIEVTVEKVAVEAVKTADNSDFDVIIVSSQLEGSDGFRLCTHLRSQDKTNKTPLLITVEESDTNLMVKALDIGINDYLITPLDNNELVARVNTQIRRKRYQDALIASHQESMELAVKDSLTGLYNRRYFDTHIENLILDSVKKKNSFSLMILDIDKFKNINDTYGHLSGDEIIKNMSKALLKGVRPSDLVVRYGGEEFVIMMPSTGINNAAKIAERIRKFIEKNYFIIPVDPGKLNCTISVGISELSPSDTRDTILERADKALYHAKRNGRNRTVILNKKKT